jgi:hypothetical protein
VTVGLADCRLASIRFQASAMQGPTGVAQVGMAALDTANDGLA